MNEQLDPINLRLIDKTVRRESQPGAQLSLPSVMASTQVASGKAPS